MTSSRAFRVFRLAAKRAVAMGQRWPGFTLRAADLFARTSRRRLGIPSADELRQLFPHLSPETARAASNGILRSEVRQDVLIHWWERSGRPGLRELVRNATVPALPKPPLIVATFHLGPLTALGAILEARIGSVFAPIVRRSLDSDEVRERRRTQTFYEAAKFVRAGGSVVIPLDPWVASSIRVPFFGGTVPLARGAFALSRMTGAPVVPLVARWRGTNVELVAGEPFVAADQEHSLAEATARWLEDYLRANPEAISLRILDLMRR